MSDDDEVTEEVLARLSREMAETVRVSLRQGEPEAVVDSQVAGEDDAPGPRTSAVSLSSRENPDDDDIMISALVSAMAKGREISASLGGGTDPVRVTVNLDAPEPPNKSGSRSSSVQRERVGFGSSAPRVTAPKVPSDADVTGPGLAYANVENLSRVARPNAPGARWGKPPPRRPALAESLAPSSTRRAAAHAGWRGLAGGVLGNTIARMPAQPADLMAWIGPGIGPTAFEVGDDVLQAFCAEAPERKSAFKPLHPGKWLCDLPALARDALRRAGVTEIHGGDLCTYTDAARFYSHRRNPLTGRMAALIWRQ